MLKVDNYNSNILKNISFEIDNKNLIILGSNGAGKTTLAHLLSGLLEHNNTVLIDGINPSFTYGDKKTKLINYIPPKLDIFDDYIDVKEFLDINNLHSNKLVEDILKLLEINYLANKPCKQLSSGESQLLLIASAILHNAKYTIFDEITANLDPLKIKKVFNLLKDKNIFNHKIIITHNLDLAYKLKYDILFIKDGKIVFNDTNENFFSDESLKVFFKDSVKKVDNNILVAL